MASNKFINIETIYQPMIYKYKHPFNLNTHLVSHFFLVIFPFYYTIDHLSHYYSFYIFLV